MSDTKSVMVVDDELSIRTGLSVLIQKTGRYRLLGLCKNGREACEAVLRQKPDIVLTDIRMPVMDGIEMINQCVRAESHAKFIILTGYGEFEYAREALRMNVFDYILKPINHEGLLELLERTSQAIDRERSLVRAQRLNSCFAALELPESPQSHTVGNARRYQVASAVIGQCDKGYTKEEIAAFVEETLCSAGYSESIAFLKDSLITVVVGDPAGLTTDLFKSLPDLLLTQFGCRVKFGVSGCCTDLSGITTCRRQSFSALREAIVCENEPVVFYSPTMESGETQSLYVTELMQLKTAVTACSEKEALAVIDGVFSTAQGSNLPAWVLFAFADKALACLGALSGKSTLQPLMCLEHFISRAQLVETVRTATIQTIAVLSEQSRNRFGKTINDILRYLDLHLQENLKISSVCQVFYINESYFCKLFKSKTGQSFHSYLTALRIAKAQELLKYGNLRVNEVAREVGFRDYKYFLRFFKEATGQTPKQYQDSMSAVSQ